MESDDIRGWFIVVNSAEALSTHLRPSLCSVHHSRSVMYEIPLWHESQSAEFELLRTQKACKS
jgi:hypothetical protein